jgi:adenylate kinase
MFGSPGSGKGTQSALLSKRYGIPVVSTGDILRSEVKSGSSLGKMVDGIISAGKMVEDSIIQPLLEERLKNSDCKEGFILDGFPRNIEQADYLGKLLGESGLAIDLVIVISLDRNLILKRLTGRFQCARCGKIYNKYFSNVKIEGVCDDCGSKSFTVRSDDVNEITTKTRLDIYEKMSEPVIEFYEKKNLTYFVDGSKSPEEIYQDILDRFSEKFSNK